MVQRQYIHIIVFGQHGNTLVIVSGKDESTGTLSLIIKKEIGMDPIPLSSLVIDENHDANDS